MHYSLISLAGLILLILTNYDVFLKIKSNHSTKFIGSYRAFLYSVLLFYIVDFFWGLFWNYKMTTPLFVISEAYFVTMALIVPFFAKYTVDYLGEKKNIKKIILIIGNLFYLFTLVVMIINLFTPIMFFVDNNGFHSLTYRIIVLVLQLSVLLMVAIYAFVRAITTKGITGRKYLAISIFGFIMVVALSIQIFMPDYSLFTIGTMIGTSMLRTFVVDIEKKEYRNNLEEALKREKEQSKELKEAWDLAYTDALTGVGSKLAYFELEQAFDKMINDREIQNLGLAVFDINNLKHVNDTLGHIAGDKYIIDACNLIQNVFKNSKVYRIGGDEFVAVFDEHDYDRRDELLEKFNDHINANIANNSVVVAIGIAEYIRDEDYSFGRIVDRADYKMYEYKKELKTRLK